MATISAASINTQKLEVVTLSKAEAANLIALLAGQLADSPIQGNHGGAAPELKIIDQGQVVKRLAFVLEQSST